MFDHDDLIDARILRRARRDFASAVHERALTNAERKRNKADRAARLAYKRSLADLRASEAWEA